jgi:Ca2+-binding RTX toxin-like protein
LDWSFQDGGRIQHLGDLTFSNIQNISLFVNTNESVIHGGSGNDTIVGISGDHIFYGEGGDDFLDGGEGRAYLDGGAGNDKIVVRVGGYGANGGAGIDTVVLQPTIYSDHYTLNERDGYLGEDTYITGFEALEWQGGWGDDVVHGGNYSDRLAGGTYGNDSLYGEGGNDVLTGGYYGDDRLFGGDGNDTIRGGLFAGKDWIVGGRGSDTMTGAGGNDKFVFSASDMRKGDRDVITDFSAGDLILTTSKIRDGNGDGIISFGANRHLDYGAGTVEIRDGAGGTVTSLAYVGTETNAGVSYYVYSLHD